MKMNESTAKKLLESIDLIKEVIKESFVQKETKPFVYTDVKSYEDACKILPVSSDNIIYTTDNLRVVAMKKLEHIIWVINPFDFVADWENRNQKKWYPYFTFSSGVRFDCSSCGCTGTIAGFGSRLCLFDEARSKYMGTQFTDLYKQFIA